MSEKDKNEMQTKIERYLLRSFFLQYFAYLSLSKDDAPTDDSIYKQCYHCQDIENDVYFD